MTRTTHLFFGVAALGALLGLVYSTFSTADFAQHLDRELHTLNCSLLPGVEEKTQLDEEAQGCQVALFSPYSSMFRDRMWGGLPVSLFAMGLFGFALVLAVWAMVARRGGELAVGIVLLLAGLSAVGASVYFFWVAVTKLHAVCKLCAGTYIGSAVLLLGAVAALLAARSDRRRRALESDEADLDADAVPAGFAPRPAGSRFAVGAFLVLLAEMGVATFLPALVFAGAVPDYGTYVRACETLRAREDKAGVLLDLGNPGGRTEALLVLDPLCAACKAFHRRLDLSTVAGELATKGLLFPLDSECNWMVSDSRHPGACLLSKALLCAGPDTATMLELLYERQDELRGLGLHGKIDEMRAIVLQRFPNVATCMDARETSIKLNKTLQYAVANELPLLTPQLYLNGKRLCDEDTDLGLDYSLARLVEQGAVAAPATRGEGAR